MEIWWEQVAIILSQAFGSCVLAISVQQKESTRCKSSWISVVWGLGIFLEWREGGPCVLVFIFVVVIIKEMLCSN